MTENEHGAYLEAIDEKKLEPGEKFRLQMLVAMVQLIEDVQEKEGLQINRNYLDKTLKQIGIFVDKSFTWETCKLAKAFQLRTANKNLQLTPGAVR